MSDGRKDLRRTQERIEEENLTDRDILHEFDNQLTLRAHDYSYHRRAKLLTHTLIIARETRLLARAIEDRDAAEDIVRWINENYHNEETNKDYRVALRVFGKHVTDGDGNVPETLAWISATTSKSYNPAPNPAQMLRWEDDVLPMINSCINDRDRAMIAVAWDLGARPGEFQSMRLGDFAEGKYGIKVHVDGKRGQRSPTLIPSVPYLNQWRTKHPRKGDPTALLWCRLDDGKRVSDNGIRKVFKQAAKRAGVTKPVTLTNFRKSSASYLASQGVSQAHLEDHHGWSRGSKVASRYIAIFGEAAEREIAKAHGIEIEEDDSRPSQAPEICPRCDREIPPNEEFCIWCNQALSSQAIDDIREKTRETRARLLAMVADRPDLLGEIESLEDIVQMLDEDPGTIEDASAFLEALGD